MHVFVLFQHTLVPKTPKGFDRVFLLEDPRVAGIGWSFSGVRIAYDLACCRQYVAEHPSVAFVPVDRADAFYKDISRFESVTCFHPHDRELLGCLEDVTRRAGTRLDVRESLLFMVPLDTITEPVRGLSSFYARIRRSMQVLVDKEGKPEGGRWSFDVENRAPYREDRARIPSRPRISHADRRQLERAYADRRVDPYWTTTKRAWPDVPEWIAPCSRAGAKRWLAHFVKERLGPFGRYQDAMLAADTTRLYHAMLSPLLNRGILSPTEVIEAVLRARDRVPLASLEGFIRQVLGWREYARYVYERTPPVSADVYRRGRSLTDAWYTGTTGLAPLDDVIQRYWQSGYAHHIERLMIVGNAMLLCDVAPIEAYRWFMEVSLDSYPWVMDLNVRMIFHLGHATSKPYASGSRYIRRQSDYPAGSWTDAWDALYTAYILRNSRTLRTVRNMGMVVHTIETLSPAVRRTRQTLARSTIRALTRAPRGSIS